MDARGSQEKMLFDSEGVGHQVRVWNPVETYDILDADEIRSCRRALIRSYALAFGLGLGVWGLMAIFPLLIPKDWSGAIVLGIVVAWANTAWQLARTWRATGLVMFRCVIVFVGALLAPPHGLLNTLLVLLRCRRALSYITKAST